MAALPAWHSELKCATPERHAEVVLILQAFLDSDDTGLNISDKQIEELPPSFFGHPEAIKRLVEFCCSGNRLTSLPTELGELSALEWFWCHNNALTALPAELGGLTALKVFDCSNNRLTELTTELGQLPVLAEFHCGDNSLQELPATLGQLTSLETLYCNHNVLQELPAELGRCEALEYLDCSGNDGLAAYWAELTVNGEPTAYEGMSPRDLATAWKARWAKMASRCAKAAR